jgi:hypothetical protein
LLVARNFFNVKIVIGFSEALLFVQDRRPAKPRLVDLEDQPTKKLIVIMNGKTVMIVMIFTVNIEFASI